MLKTKPALTNQARKIKMKRQYNRLKKRLHNRDLKAWIQNWELMYVNAVTLVINKALEDQQSQRDFLVIVAKYKPSFNDNYLLRIFDESEAFEI